MAPMCPTTRSAKAIENGQLRLQKERGSDLTLFSPIAGLMSHHLGNERTSLEWAEVSNDLVHRVCDMYPDNFVPVCQLPQSPMPRRRRTGARAAPLHRGNGFRGLST
jgi:4-oxalmesaconate hydratase